MTWLYIVVALLALNVIGLAWAIARAPNEEDL